MTTQDPDLACRHVVEMVTDYLEGALPTESAEQLEQHLLICEACAIYLNQHRTMLRALTQLSEREQPSVERARDAALQMFRRLRKRGDDDGDGQP